MNDPKNEYVQVSLRDGFFASEIASRQCLVCERFENPNALIVNDGAAWLCPECKSRIKRLLYPEEG